MKRELLSWQKFAKSGDPKDYIEYCRVKRESPKEAAEDRDRQSEV